MYKKHSGALRNGFLNISLASVIAGIMVVGNFIYAKITNESAQNQMPTAPVTQTVTPSQTTTTDVLPPSPLAETQTPAAALLKAAAPENCGNDPSCLVASAQICSPATASFTSTFDAFGMNETIGNNYAIIGPSNSGTCSYTVTLTSVAIAPDDAFKTEAAVHKTSLANIQSDLASAQAALAKTVGTMTACSQPSATIVQFIDGMNAGTLAAQYMPANTSACTITPPITNSVNAAAPATSATQ